MNITRGMAFIIDAVRSSLEGWKGRDNEEKRRVSSIKGTMIQTTIVFGDNG